MRTDEEIRKRACELGVSEELIRDIMRIYSDEIARGLSD